MVTAVAPPASAQYPQPVPPPMPMPMPPMPDPETERMEAEFTEKRFQLVELRRARARLPEAQMLNSLKREERLLTELINLSIALDKSSAEFEQRHTEVAAEIKKIEQGIAETKGRLARADQLVDQADQARRKGDVLGAKRLLTEAAKLDPTNRRLGPSQVWVDRALSERWVGRLIAMILAGGVLVGGLVAGWFAWRRKKKVSTLEMIEGPNPGEIFRLEKDATVIGALDSESDWAIVDLSRRISRRHCEIERSGRRYFLTDVSTNGTKINGKPAPAGEPTLLRRGDLIALADDVVLRFR
jgi:FHA domain